MIYDGSLIYSALSKLIKSPFSTENLRLLRIEVNIQNDLPELSNYSELSSKEQLTIHQMLISYVRSDHLYNIILTHNVEPYDLVKLVSISFENRDAAKYPLKSKHVFFSELV